MIPLIWYSLFANVDGAAQFDGGRGILGDLFRGQYGRVPLLVEMTNADPRFMGRNDTAVVVVPGQHHADRRSYEWLNEDLSRVGSVLLILHGDEASLFDWRQVQHPNVRWWVMTPRRSVHDAMPDGTRFFGEGAGPTVTLPPVAKDLDLVWMGQLTHDRRAELVANLERLNPATTLCESTPGFLQGRARPDYLTQMARGRIAPCPSGAATADSFRLYEALTVGCVPIVERRTPDGADHDVWGLMYPDGMPWPTVDSWDELPELLPWMLADFDGLARSCQEWWRWQRSEYARWLRDDLVSLVSGTVGHG